MSIRFTFLDRLRVTRPRVITVDGNRSYSKVIAELKQEQKLGRRCRCRTCPYSNNLVEQDHGEIKRRVNASQGFRSFDGAWRTHSGMRGSAHDPERLSEMVAERGCARADSVHPGNPRIEKLAHQQTGNRLGLAREPSLQHNRMEHRARGIELQFFAAHSAIDYRARRPS